MVVGVEDDHGAGTGGGGAEDGMSGAPRLAPGGAEGVLVDDLQRQVGAVLLLEVGTQHGVEVRTSDDHHLPDAGLESAVDGVVEEGLAVRADRHQLLVAPEPGAQSPGHHEERDVGRVHAPWPSPPRSPRRKASRAASPTPRRLSSYVKPCSKR